MPSPTLDRTRFSQMAEEISERADRHAYPIPGRRHHSDRIAQRPTGAQLHGVELSTLDGTTVNTSELVDHRRHRLRLRHLGWGK